MFRMLVVLFLQPIQFPGLVLALEVHICARLPHVISLDGFLNDGVPQHTEGTFNIGLRLQALVVRLQVFELLVEFLDDLFLMRINLGVHDLLCQVVNLIVNLGEVTVNLIFPDYIMVEGLLFRAIPKLLVVKHELLCLRIVNDRGRGRIFLVDHWQVASWRLVYYVAILVKERQVFQDGV